MVNYYKFQPKPFGDDEIDNKIILKKYYEDIIRKNYIILGYNYMFERDLTDYTNEEIDEICKQKLPEKPNVPLMIKLFRSIVPGDIIFVHFPKNFPEEVVGKSLIGVVKSTAYKFDREYGFYSDDQKPEGHNHILHVQWLPNLFDIGDSGAPRSSLSQLSSLNFIKTINEKIKKISNEEETDLNNQIDILKSKKQIILYGPPGTGKTYNTKELAVNLIGDKNDNT